jgi:hypothetical protein
LLTVGTGLSGRAGGDERLALGGNREANDVQSHRKVGPVRNQSSSSQLSHNLNAEGNSPMNGIIYLVGLVVIVLALLSWLGLS